MRKNNKVKIYSALEVANICGVVNQTAINWIKKEYLKAFVTPGGQYRVYGDDLFSFMKTRGMRIPEELKDFVNLGTKKVLLVEDDNAFADQFLEEIKSEYPNCFVDRALDGFEAGSKLALNDTDLVLLNADITSLDCLKICKAIKSGSVKGMKSLIVFTENVNKQGKENYLAAGADVYIKKPFDIGQISIYLE